MATQAEREFHREVVAGADRLKREIGYNPQRFNQMVGNLGGPAAARQLLRGDDASDGFTKLWEAGRLDMSVEAIALLPWYSSLFEPEERAIAERRLELHGFDVRHFLSSHSSPPPWAANRDSTPDAS